MNDAMTTHMFGDTPREGSNVESEHGFIGTQQQLANALYKVAKRGGKTASVVCNTAADILWPTPAEAPAQEVKVKALAWEKREVHRWAADAMHRMIYITEYAGMAEPFQLDLRGCDSKMFPTLDAAKDAAQADYNARILSALDLT